MCGILRSRFVLVSFIVVIASLSGVLSGAAWSPNQTSTTTTMGMGDFTLPIVDRDGLTGKNLTLSDFRGKVIVLEFMVPWCPDCWNLVPFMESLYNNYTKRGVVFIAVDIAWKPDLSRYWNVTITQFLNEYNSSLTYVYDSGSMVSNMYNIRWVPTLVVLSKSGAVEDNGYLEVETPVAPKEQEASAAIDAALGQASTPSSYQFSPIIPGFSIDSVVLGLIVGFALLIIARRKVVKNKSMPRKRAALKD